MTLQPGIGGFNLGQDWIHQTAPVLGPQAVENAYRWATVTVSSPLQIQLDGDSLPLPLTPENLIEGGPPQVGARVWVQLFNRRVICLGVAGGLAPSYPPFGHSPFSMAAITFTVAGTGATAYNQAFAWPTSRFTQSPMCSIAIVGGTLNQTAFFPQFFSAPSATSGFASVICRDNTVTDVNAIVQIIGVQMTASSGSG